VTDTFDQLADKMAIRELVYTYCRAVDRLDVPLGHSIWHDDGHADYGKDFYQGPGKAIIDVICESHLAMTSHSHQVTNILIELDGDKAGSESYIFGTMRFPPAEDKPTQIFVWGRYLDRWEKRDGKWGLVHRQFVYDHDEIREVSPLGQQSAAARDTSDPSYQVLSARKWGQGSP